MFILKQKFFTLLTTLGVFVFGLFTLFSYQQEIADFVFARYNGVTAALTAVTLNNGNGNVVSGSDISSQTTSLSPDIGAYRWTVNGSGYMALNMPLNSGATQTDFSGNANHLSITGVPTLSAGKVGSAYTFAAGQYMLAADSNSLDITSQFSTSFWFFQTDATGDQNVITKGNTATTTSNYDVRIFNGSIRFLWKNGGNYQQFSTPETLFSINSWHHIVITHAFGTTANSAIYIDGVNAGGSCTFGDCTLSTSANSDALAISGHGAPLTDYIGLLDEIQIYRRILSPAQALQLYNDGNAGLGGPTIIQSEETAVGQVWDLSITPITSSGTVGSAIESTNPVVIVSGAPTITGTLDNPDAGSPIISSLTIPGGSTASYRWLKNSVTQTAMSMPFNTGGTQSDLSGNVNDGTTTNGAVFTTSDCQVGGCMVFDGVNDYVVVSDSASMSFNSSMTITAWIKPTAFGAGYQNLINSYDDFGNQLRFQFYLTPSGGLGAGVSANGVNAGGREGVGSVTAGAWNFVALSFDTVSTRLRFYVNGSKVDDTAIGITGLFDSNRSHYIGILGNNSGLSFATPFGGRIDELQLFTSSLSQAQILQIYQDGAAGVGGPTRISAQEHALGETWDLIATEISSLGAVGSANYIDSTVVVGAIATTLGISTPGTTQSNNVTISYSCTNNTSLLRDLLVEYSVNGGSSYASATLVSASSGSVAGSLLSMVACNSGTSNNSFVWNSVPDNVAIGVLDADVRIRITAQYPSGPSAETGNFSVQNAAINTFTSPTTIGTGNTDYENEHVICSGTTLTVDGTHTFASLTLQNNCTLTQTATTTSTLNRTILNITGATDIQSGSTVNMTAKGYPNGYTAGVAGAPTTTGGATGNSGGSHGGFGYPVSGTAGVTYDSVFAPLYPGAGAANASVGGGYLQLTTASFNLAGTIQANAATGGGGANTGAGGGVWLTVTGAWTGAGSVSANGGNGTINNFHGFGGGGRIAVHYSSAVSGNPSVTTMASRLQAYGGSTGGGTLYGAAGTVYIEDTSVRAANDGDVFVNNNNTASALFTPLTGTLGSISIQNRGAVVADTLTVSRDVLLTTTSNLTHDFSTTSTTRRLTMTVGGLTSVDSTSSINVMGRGFPNGYTADGSGNPTLTGGATGNSGGSHGGFGYPVGGTAGAPYDSIFQPLHPGAGAANSGIGGGYVKLTTGSLSLAGTINATAAAAGGGANTGAGGGVWIIATGAVSVTGTISANGGSGTINNSHGIGSGGRIAVHYNTSVPGNPSTTSLANQLQAWSGTGSGGTLYGAAGTVYVEDTSTHAANDGIVIINNNNLATSMFTTPSSPLGELQIKNRAIARVATFVINRNLTITTNSTLTHDTTTTSTTYRIDGTIGGLMSVDATSSVNVVGKGYPNGYTADANGDPTTVGGATGNSGGSHGGFGYPVSGTGGSPYDSIFTPLHPGAGAANSSTGGGYVKLTAGSFTLAGTINATAASAGGGANTGAGGGVWITVTGALSVTGTIVANGGSGTINNAHGIGSGGRVAVYYNTSVPGNPTTTSLANQLQAWSGTGSGGTLYGGAGTVYIEDTSTHASNDGIVIVNNNNLATSMYTAPSSPIGELQIKNRAVVRFATFIVNRDLVMTGTSTLTHDTTTTTTTYRLNGTIGGLFSVDGTSSVNVFAKGYPSGYTADSSGNPTTVGAANGNNGGSHGGFGGLVSGSAGTPYDSIFTPLHPGAGAANSSTGGGYVKITAEDLTLAGTINATAANGGGGANSGAGGGIWIIVTGDVNVTGTIAANGGNGVVNNAHGIGSGGRIAFYYNSSVGSNPLPATLKSQLQAYSGTGSGGTLYGAAGTIYIEDSSQHATNQGTLIVDNNNLNAGTRRTPLFVVGQGYTTVTLDDLYVNRFGNLVIDTPCAGTPALTVNGFTDTSNNGTITNNQGGSCTVTQAAINITTTSLPGVVVGGTYNQAVQSAGGYGPHTFVCRNAGITVACTTVLPPGLDMNSSGVISGTATTVGTYAFTVRATEAAPGIGTDEQALSIGVGNAPSTPTSLFVHNTNAQLGNTNPSGIDTSPVFSAIFNDADAGETATKYRVQVASDAGFTTLLWESGSAGTALSVACNQGFRCVNINYAGSALSLSATTYYWRIKFWDVLNIEGTFSATNQFTTDIAPTAPTNLFSNDSAAQTGLTNPVGVLAAHPVFSAIYNDPDLGDVATKYRIQVDDNNNFSSVVWDSGAAGTSMANCNQGARCADIVFGGTDLAADEKIYYWRIKFFDQAGVESPWSQDPLSTNTFQMGLGGSSQQRIAEQQAQDQQQLDESTAPSAPIAGAVEVLDAHTLRFNWIDTSSNETGFRILDANNQVLIDLQTADTTRTTETNLPANTVVQGRKVLAYNAIGQSTASEFASATTAAQPVQPVLRSRGPSSVTFSIQPAMGTFVGQTAIRFEVIAISPITGQTRTLTSEWIQSNEYTFEGIAENETVQVRAYSRNQLAIATEPSTYQDLEGISRQFHVNMGVFKKGTNILPRPLATSDALSVSVQIQNVGSETATNVLVSMPLPRYILYKVGTLTADGRIQSDSADQDAGQASGNAVSAIWAQVAPNETHTLTFELIFDEGALNALRPQPENSGTASQAQAAANPIINLQVAVSFAESDQVFASPVISLEPDTTTVQEEPELPVPPPITVDAPVPLPTPEEVQQINEFLNQIIQQEVEESGGDTGTTPPSGPQAEPTTVSSDGPSFNVEAKNADGEMLSLTGLAKANDDQIEFTGTTSQPFTIVMLIFNNSVTAIVVSDANGEWHTFVSADQLGIKPGQESTVKIEAIASKGNLQSERVQVGEVKIALGRSGDIEAEFDTTVSSNNVVTVINEVRKEVVRVIEEQQPVIQTALSVTAPVVVVSSVPLWGYLPYVPTMIYHFLTYLLGLIGRKKKGQQRFYGVVYDSITKQPLPLAIVRIYSAPVTPLVIPSEAGAEARPELVEGGSLSQVRKLVSTTVTDKLGRYEALLAPGKYMLEVTKPAYQFPSQIVTTELDANFHTYKAQDGMTIGEQGTEITVPDVPLDPVNAQRQWQLTGGFKKVWLSVQKVGNYLAVPVLLVGSIVSVATVAAIPDKGINWLLAIMYVLLLAAQLRLRPKLLKAWGVVYDITTNAVLPLTTIQLIDPQYGKVVTSRLSDYEGRFSFLPEPGNYVVKASKSGFTQVTEVVESPYSDRQPLTQTIDIKKPNERVSGDIAMRQG